MDHPLHMSREQAERLDNYRAEARQEQANERAARGRAAALARHRAEQAAAETETTAEGMAADPLLTPGEVAALFRVDPKTVTRWAAAGRIGSIRTPGGHRRFRESEVRALLRGTEGSR